MNAFFIAPAISGASLRRSPPPTPRSSSGSSSWPGSRPSSAARLRRPPPWGSGTPSRGRSSVRGPTSTRCSRCRAPRSPSRPASASTPVGTGSVCFRGGRGAAFGQTQADIVDLLNADPGRPTCRSRTDSFGFTWLTVTGDPGDVTGLCTDLHAVNTTLEEQGSAPGCSARWSRSRTRAAGASDWSTSTSRARSTRSRRPGAQQQRDNLLEIQVRDALAGELPMEKDLSSGSPSGVLRGCETRRSPLPRCGMLRRRELHPTSSPPSPARSATT